MSDTLMDKVDLKQIMQYENTITQYEEAYRLNELEVPQNHQEHKEVFSATKMFQDALAYKENYGNFIANANIHTDATRQANMAALKAETAHLTGRYQKRHEHHYKKMNAYTKDMRQSLKELKEPQTIFSKMDLELKYTNQLYKYQMHFIRAFGNKDSQEKQKLNNILIASKMASLKIVNRSIDAYDAQLSDPIHAPLFEREGLNRAKQLKQDLEASLRKMHVDYYNDYIAYDNRAELLRKSAKEKQIKDMKDNLTQEKAVTDSELYKKIEEDYDARTKDNDELKNDFKDPALSHEQIIDKRNAYLNSVATAEEKMDEEVGDQKIVIKGHFQTLHELEKEQYLKKNPDYQPELNEKNYTKEEIRTKLTKILSTAASKTRKFDEDTKDLDKIAFSKDGIAAADPKQLVYWLRRVGIREKKKTSGAPFSKVFDFARMAHYYPKELSDRLSEDEKLLDSLKHDMTEFIDDPNETLVYLGSNAKMVHRIKSEFPVDVGTISYNTKESHGRPEDMDSFEHMLDLKYMKDTFAKAREKYKGRFGEDSCWIYMPTEVKNFKNNQGWKLHVAFDSPKEFAKKFDVIVEALLKKKVSFKVINPLLFSREKFDDGNSWAKAFTIYPTSDTFFNVSKDGPIFSKDVDEILFKETSQRAAFTDKTFKAENQDGHIRTTARFCSDHGHFISKNNQIEYDSRSVKNEKNVALCGGPEVSDIKDIFRYKNNMIEKYDLGKKLDLGSPDSLDIVHLKQYATAMFLGRSEEKFNNEISVQDKNSDFIYDFYLADNISQIKDISFCFKDNSSAVNYIAVPGQHRYIVGVLKDYFVDDLDLKADKMEDHALRRI